MRATPKASKSVADVARPPESLVTTSLAHAWARASFRLAVPARDFSRIGPREQFAEAERVAWTFADSVGADANGMRHALGEWRDRYRLPICDFDLAVIARHVLKAAAQ